MKRGALCLVRKSERPSALSNYDVYNEQPSSAALAAVGTRRPRYSANNLPLSQATIIIIILLYRLWLNRYLIEYALIIHGIMVIM